jgi:hypothetical protein
VAKDATRCDGYTAFANTLALSGDRTLAIEVFFGWMGLLKVSYTPIWLSGRFPAV